MKTLVIGHRGVGKTSFIARVRSYFEDAGAPAAIFDLDLAVEAFEGASIASLFYERGEAYFRACERRELARIASARGEPEVWVAAGAGFAGDVPNGWRCLWLSRASDQTGRVFLDRPRLNPELAPLAEFQRRRAERDVRYATLATDRLELDEGFERENCEEKLYALGRLREIGGAVTALPWHFRDSAEPLAQVRRRLAWGARFVELRDDLLPLDQIERAARALPPPALILSARDSRRARGTADLARELATGFDWPLELGRAPNGFAPSILSAHERAADESMVAFLDRLAQAGEAFPAVLLKASPMTFNLHELWSGELWRRKDPARRAFLPRSESGRWAWHRLATKSSQPLNFWRECGAGSALDQPPLLRWARARGSREFAAVLGHPVAHSRTPAEQLSSANELGMDVFAIDVTEREWDDGALDILRELGLRCAAITAPLKGRAFQACAQLDAVARRAEAANSLAWSPERGAWSGANTDVGGLRAAGLKQNIFVWTRLAVWGGGGALAAAREALPSARFFSARSGRLKPGDQPLAVGWTPDALLWAVGRSRMNDGAQWPPAAWTPRAVFDLNYAEDSPGREYAARVGASYASGLEMFREQARLQAEFWRSLNGERR